MKKIIKYVAIDILKNKIILTYTVCLFLFSFSIFNVEDIPSKGLLSLLNIVLIIVPLVSVLFPAIYVYNSSEFIELLVSQPLKRKTIWLSLFAGLSASMVLAYFTGVGIPVLIYQPDATGLTLILTGALLSVVFVAIAMLAAIRIRDKAKGIGVAILLWLYFSLLFDGLLLFILFQFADYPVEKFITGIITLNPIDLCRILVLLKMDVSALMGYTGAVFKDFFGSQWGTWISVLLLVTWSLFPLLLSLRRFKTKDL